LTVGERVVENDTVPANPFKLTKVMVVLAVCVFARAIMFWLLLSVKVGLGAWVYVAV